MTAKAVLITGCFSGIGDVAAKTLHQCGYCVNASCRRPEDVACLQFYGLPHVILLNPADSDSINRAKATVIMAGLKRVLSGRALDWVISRVGG